MTSGNPRPNPGTHAPDAYQFVASMTSKGRTPCAARTARAKAMGAARCPVPERARSARRSSVSHRPAPTISTLPSAPSSVRSSTNARTRAPRPAKLCAISRAAVASPVPVGG